MTLINATLLILVGFTCMMVDSVPITNLKNDRLGVVVDAGGSGTRLIVYRYHDNGELSQLKYIKCEDRGLARYSENQFQQLRDLLNKCFKEGAQSLPTGKKVPMYFAATAGMRLLRLRNPVLYGKIWSVVTSCITASEFKQMSSRTISGFEEAKWGWVAANYLRKTLNKGRTYGTVELGSSSTQLAFQIDASKGISEHVRSLHIDGQKVDIYGHSYLCYGVVEMLRRFNAKVVKDSGYSPVVKNPCYNIGYSMVMPSNYLWKAPCSSGDYARDVLGEEIKGPSNKTYLVKGSGDFNQCYALLKKLLDRRCTKSSCGMNNVFQSSFNNNEVNFLALSTFYYVAKSLGLNPSSNQESYVRSSLITCAEDYEPERAGKYDHVKCFQAAYGYYLLHSFGFPKNWNIEFIKKIDGKRVGWPLGLIYMKKDEMFNRVLKKTD